jgi:hypothetical protein
MIKVIKIKMTIKIFKTEGKINLMIKKMIINFKKGKKVLIKMTKNSIKIDFIYNLFNYKLTKEINFIKDHFFFNLRL